MGERALVGLFSLALVHGAVGETPAIPPGGIAAPDELARELDTPLKPVWRAGLGKDFRTSVQTFSIETGAAFGPAHLGSQESHHLALLSFAYGHKFGPVFGENRWWRGSFELRLELFGATQFSPRPDWLVGLTPHVRYNFTAGSRWIPFLDAGVGVSLTGIGPPDLGTMFEFNSQSGLGVHWLLRDNLALTFEGRYMHISNAGISDYNGGLNAWMGMLGVTVFF